MTKRSAMSSGTCFPSFLLLLILCPWNIVLANTQQLVEPPIKGPPYAIIQVGDARSGSTFQFQLLAAIVALKIGRHAAEDARFEYMGSLDGAQLHQDMAQNRSFVIKTHSQANPNIATLQELKQEGRVVVFSSSSSSCRGKLIHDAVYCQQKEKLQECSMCEIDEYQELFGLTSEEMGHLKEHIGLYQVLRRCCGFQMSKYEVQRLNGCDMSEYVNRPGYPHCERHNLTDVELRFDASPILFHQHSESYNWAKPGDCARMNKVVASGKGFNKHEFRGCGD